ncbi:hypothetical protein, partial [Limosilactobacillus fermentum]|uniref:hypothetical protein n=2 Tax=Limosilactobacillus fermentum TaxID=1613 RepID=UPI001F06A23D
QWCIYANCDSNTHQKGACSQATDFSQWWLTSMDWSEGNAFTHNGIQYFSVHSWLQETAPHNYCGVTTEKVNGQDTRVLLLAEGGHVQVQEVGYPTEQLAKDNVDTKFDNLDYQ